MRTELDSLDSPREAVEGTACLVVLAAEFFHFLIIDAVLFMKPHKFSTDHVIHLLVGVFHFLLLFHRSEAAVRNPGNGSTDTARRDSPLQDLEYSLCHCRWFLSLNLSDAYRAQPSWNIETRARLAGVQLMMSNDTDLREPRVEVLHIAFQRFALRLGARILRLPGFVAAPHIYNMSAHAVIACSTVGHFPWINISVLVVINESFHVSVQVHHVCIAYLFPTTACRRGLSVPAAYFVRAHLTPLRGGRAVDNEILY
nr:MAG TPA: hypothetical protein [Caudoviricetes sp.]